MSDDEDRSRVRHLADLAISDAFITYVAMLREEDLAGPGPGMLALDEMGAALTDLATTLRSALDIARSDGVAGSDPLQVAVLSVVTEGEIEALIEERRVALRSDAS